MGGQCSGFSKKSSRSHKEADKENHEEAYALAKSGSSNTFTSLSKGDKTQVSFKNERLPTIPSTLDINTATEEDFMTLPTIGRVLAHNIVEHRSKLGQFQAVEDLALVSGIGATRLEKLRKEIHVTSTNSEQLKTPSNNRESLSKLVNINTAPEEQLMKVDGITQNVAEKIIEYRNKVGKFYHINDLVEPAGVLDIHALLKLKSYLTVDKSDNRRSRKASLASVIRNGSSEAFFHSGPESLNNTRPMIEEFHDAKDGRSIIRIATWNLQQCTIEKVNNLGVREVICATILENGIKLLAVQELADKEVLQKIADELNNPTLPNIQRAKTGSESWECAVSSTASGRMYQGNEYNGFLFDANSKVELFSHALLEKPMADKEFARLPLLGYFKINQVDLVVVCVHLKAIGRSASATDDLARLNDEIQNLPLLVDAIKERVPVEKDVMIVGDFNLEPNQKEFDVLRNSGFSAVVSESIPTNISTKNMKGSRCYDNVWLSKNASLLYTNQFKVVRSGLTNPWIPDGWSWGGVASDHCPVWAEFFTDKDFDPEAADKNLENLRLSS